MKYYILLPLCTLACMSITNAKGQETVQELSKKANKGFLYDVSDKSDQLTVTYKIPGEKKNADALFESYSFDKNIRFVKTENSSASKESKPDITVDRFYAYVGGSSSFDALSMKVKLNTKRILESWSHEKQAYIATKILSNEMVKPKNDNGRIYRGYAAFITRVDNTTDDLVVLAANDSKDKKKINEYFMLNVGSDLIFKETALELDGAQTLVYCDQLTESKDIAMVFAPDKGNGDASNYTYLRFSQKGKLINKTAFKSPSSNLLIMSVNESNGSVFFCGSSTKSKDSYDEVFSEFASIVSPGFKDANNMADFKYQKKAKEKMDNFHLLKFTSNQLDFATTAPIDGFKAKFKSAGKGASPYKGSRFYVEQFYVTPNQEYLIAGQLTGSTNLGLGNPVKTYEDLVCLHFDGSGNLKTQFGVAKLNDDKKSEIFEMKQEFHLGKDGKSLYWEIKEVKGLQGYDSFLDAFYGNKTLFPVFYPRIAKLDLAGSSVSDFKILGNEKFFLRKDFTSLFNKEENSITYIGHDEDFKKLWLSKYVFE